MLLCNYYLKKKKKLICFLYCITSRDSRSDVEGGGGYETAGVGDRHKVSPHAASGSRPKKSRREEKSSVELGSVYYYFHFLHLNLMNMIINMKIMSLINFWYCIFIFVFLNNIDDFWSALLWYNKHDWRCNMIDEHRHTNIIIIKIFFFVE